MPSVCISLHIAHTFLCFSSKLFRQRSHLLSRLDCDITQKHCPRPSRDQNSTQVPLRSAYQKKRHFKFKWPITAATKLAPTQGKRRPKQTQIHADRPSRLANHTSTQTYRQASHTHYIWCVAEVNTDFASLFLSHAGLSWSENWQGFYCFWCTQIPQDAEGFVSLFFVLHQFSCVCVSLL